VVLDFGLWTRKEREDFRHRAALLGATTVVHFLNVPHHELLVRLEKRNRGRPEDVTYIPPEKLKQWFPKFEPPDAVELESTES